MWWLGADRSHRPSAMGPSTVNARMLCSELEIDQYKTTEEPTDIESITAVDVVTLAGTQVCVVAVQQCKAHVTESIVLGLKVLES